MALRIYYTQDAMAYSQNYFGKKHLKIETRQKEESPVESGELMKLIGSEHARKALKAEYLVLLTLQKQDHSTKW
jgi:hypothetical protein